MRLWNNTSSAGVNDHANTWAEALYWLLLIGGCAVFLLMNIYTTIKDDDLFHSYIQDGSLRPIDSLLDALRGWLAYYKYDARIANIISFTFNGVLGKSVFNICNTLVFGIMAHLLSRMSTGRNSAMVLVMLYAYMVTAMPVPGETLLWATAAFNYLWAFTASLLFIAYLLWHRNSRPGWLLGTVVLLLSFFAGGINEGTTLGVFGGLVVYYLFNRRKVDRAVAIAMTGYLLGVLLLLTCPGTWNRASDEIAHNYGWVSLLIERTNMLLKLSLRYVTPAVAVVVMLAGLVMLGVKKAVVHSPWPWVLLALMGFAFLVGKPQPRLFFSISMAAFVIMSMGVYSLLKRALWLRLAVVVVGLAVCAKLYPGNIRTLKHYQEFFNQVDTDIKQTPGRQVILKERIFTDYSRFIKYFNFESDNFLIREEALCLYYDKDNIQFVPDTIYSQFNAGTLLDGAEPMPFASPHAGIEAVIAVPGQEYMAVKLHQDTVSRSYQMAQAFQADDSRLLPVPFFPLLYQGHEYLIFPIVDNKIARLVFSPYSLEGESVELVRTGPNPEWTDQDVGR